MTYATFHVFSVFTDFVILREYRIKQSQKKSIN